MLILGRRQTESIQIGTQISVTVLSISGNQVRLGIEAPGNISIYRSELPADISERLRGQTCPNCHISRSDLTPQCVCGYLFPLGNSPPAKD